MLFPDDQADYFRRLARETARISYPGGMSGRVVDKNTKTAVEGYFVNDFHIEYLWLQAGAVAERSDDWHKERTDGLCKYIGLQKETNQREAVAAKFIDTFMHQLMKYEDFRPLYSKLHLALDGVVFKALSRYAHLSEYPSLHPVQSIFQMQPYSIKYAEYERVQSALAQLVVELNDRADCNYRLRGRIDLNALIWAA